MVKIQYVGLGMLSRGIKFTKDNGGIFEVDKEFGDYLVNTFPNDFNLIEAKATKQRAKATTKSTKKATTKKDIQELPATE